MENKKNKKLIVLVVILLLVFCSLFLVWEFFGDDDVFVNEPTDVSFHIPPGFAVFAYHNNILEQANPSDFQIFLCPKSGCLTNPTSVSKITIDQNPINQNQSIDSELEARAANLFPGVNIDDLVITHISFDNNPAVSIESKDPNLFGNNTVKLFVNNGYVVSVLENGLEQVEDLKQPETGTLVSPTNQNSTDEDIFAPPSPNTETSVPSVVPNESGVIIKNFVVDAGKHYLCKGCVTALDTGIDISETDNLEVHVVGKWDIGINPESAKYLGKTEANGFTTADNVTDFGTNRGMPIGALAGAIGTKDLLRYTFLGKDYNDPVYLSGRLYLLAWDTIWEDNAGIMTVRVIVTKNTK